MKQPKSGNDFYLSVPENLLSAIKASFLCYSQHKRNELMESLSNRIMPAMNRRDPTLKEFMAAMTAFVELCKNNPKEDFLLL